MVQKTNRIVLEKKKALTDFRAFRFADVFIVWSMRRRVPSRLRKVLAEDRASAQCRDDSDYTDPLLGRKVFSGQ
jgi:hypothetical protein